MAGAGTTIERHAEGEFLVSVRPGFLNLDAQSGQVSVDEKIVSRDAVSSRTTGNLNEAIGRLRGIRRGAGKARDRRRGHHHPRRRVIKLMSARVGELSTLEAQRKAAMDQMTGEPEVRKYVMLASRIRKKELILTAEQLPAFQKMALAVGPALKAIAKVSLKVKAAETEQQAGQALVAQLIEQRNDSDGVSQVAVRMVQGDTIVRTMPFNPDGSSTYDLPAKGIQARLRASGAGRALIFSGSDGAVEWVSE